MLLTLCCAWHLVVFVRSGMWFELWCRQQHKNVVTWDFAGGWRSVRSGWQCLANNGSKTWRKVKGKQKQSIKMYCWQRGQDWIRSCVRNHLRLWGLVGEGVSDISQLHLAVEHGFGKMALYALIMLRLVKQG